MDLNLSYREGHVVITYGENDQFAEVQTHSADGKPHDLSRRRVSLDNVPALLFILVEHDYVVAKGTAEQFKGISDNIIIASRRDLVT